MEIEFLQLDQKFSKVKIGETFIWNNLVWLKIPEVVENPGLNGKVRNALNLSGDVINYEYFSNLTYVRIAKFKLVELIDHDH